MTTQNNRLNNLKNFIENNEIKSLENIFKGNNIINNDDKNTALLHAIFIQNNEMAKLLIKNGADINCKDNNNDYTTYGEYAIHIATKSNNIKNVQLLIKNGANVNVQDKVGDTSIMKINSNIHLLMLLWNNNDKEDFKSCKRDMFKILKLLVKTGGNEILSIKNIDDYTLINDIIGVYGSYGYFQNNEEMSKVIYDLIFFYIKNGGDIKHKHLLSHKTILSQVIDINFKQSHPHIKLIRLLIKKHNNINDCDTLGNSSLHIAMYKKNYEIVKLLIENGGDPLLKNEEEHTPKDLATILNLDKKFIDIFEKNIK